MNQITFPLFDLDLGCANLFSNPVEKKRKKDNLVKRSSQCNNPEVNANDTYKVGNVIFLRIKIQGVVGTTLSIWYNFSIKVLVHCSIFGLF